MNDLLALQCEAYLARRPGEHEDVHKYIRTLRVRYFIMLLIGALGAVVVLYLSCLYSFENPHDLFGPMYILLTIPFGLCIVHGGFYTVSLHRSPRAFLRQRVFIYNDGEF